MVEEPSPATFPRSARELSRGIVFRGHRSRCRYGDRLETDLWVLSDRAPQDDGLCDRPELYDPAIQDVLLDLIGGRLDADESGDGVSFMQTR